MWHFGFYLLLTYFGWKSSNGLFFDPPIERKREKKKDFLSVYCRLWRPIVSLTHRSCPFLRVCSTMPDVAVPLWRWTEHRTIFFSSSSFILFRKINGRLMAELFLQSSVAFKGPLDLFQQHLLQPIWKIVWKARYCNRSGPLKAHRIDISMTGVQRLPVFPITRLLLLLLIDDGSGYIYKWRQPTQHNQQQQQVGHLIRELKLHTNRDDWADRGIKVFAGSSTSCVLR